jgi:hypothetical protein
MLVRHRQDVRHLYKQRRETSIPSQIRENGALALPRIIHAPGDLSKVWLRRSAQQLRLVGFQEGPQRHGLAPPTGRAVAVIVVTHRQAAGIGPGRKLVVLAAVDLHLILEESMVQVAGDGERGERGARRGREGGLDRERCIRQTRTLCLGDHGRYSRRGHAAPGLRQCGQDRAVTVLLRDVAAARIAVLIYHVSQAMSAGKIAVKIVEGAIFGVNHHDVLDFGMQRRGDDPAIAVVPVIVVVVATVIALIRDAHAGHERHRHGRREITSSSGIYRHWSHPLFYDDQFLERSS